MQDQERRALLRRGLAVGVVMLLITLSTVPGLAQTGPNTMNFQGQLLDSSGNPLTSSHCVRFRLCSDSSCDTQVWPQSGFEYHAVTPESGTYKAGLFSVVLGSTEAIPPKVMYDSDELFLELGVADEASCPGSTWWTLTPRSQLRASAYAQRSRRVRTSESDDGNLVHVENMGQGGAIYGRTNSTLDGTAAGYFQATGAYGETRGVYGQAASLYGDGVHGMGGYRGVYGKGADPTGITYGVYGTSEGASGYGVWGQSVHKDGVHGSSTNSNGVYGSTSSSGNGTAGVFGVASAAAGETYGVYGQALSADGYGVYSMGDAHIAGDLSWTSKTSYISIGPTGFDPYMGYGVVPEIKANEITPPPGCTSDQQFGYVAHLQLPHGGVLKSVTFFWMDASPSQNSRLQLLRSGLTGGSSVILADMFTSGSAETPDSTTYTFPVVDSFSTIDNSSNTYLLMLGLYCDTALYAATIEYTIDAPY